MEVKQFGGGVPPVIRGCLTDAWPRDHGWGHDVERPEMNFYAGELRVKMRYSVFHTQLHHDSRQVYRNLDVSCTIVEILWLAKCLVLRKLGREVTKRRGVSKCRPVLWSSSGRWVPACIHGFLLSSPISIVESDVTCLLRSFERFVYDMHSHK